jgi:hypothetical protein
MTLKEEMAGTAPGHHVRAVCCLAERFNADDSAGGKRLAAAYAVRNVCSIPFLCVSFTAQC